MDHNIASRSHSHSHSHSHLKTKLRLYADMHSKLYGLVRQGTSFTALLVSSWKN
jgi:hypothetical protein